MIARLRGKVIDRDADTIVVDVGGVGYSVRVCQMAFPLGDDVDLYVHTHVREDTFSLFGFRTPEEREIFHLLLTVPSIGPVKAMGILATPILELVQMVVDRDVKRLGKLQGVGKRTAERMVVDLRDRFEILRPSLRGGTASDVVEMAPERRVVTDDLVSALVNLGFKPAVADREAQALIAEVGVDTGLDVLLRQALERLRRL